ncbi:hypothetical protein GR7B_00024 [Vibrio phage vB_VcorM_GR7B]|nr:hypothetical protein GR7B_00024 [Vibrio phage vB_VcorM_GR7B]
MAEITLNGNQIKKVTRDEEGNLVSAIIMIGRFAMPLVGDDIKALRNTISINRDESLHEWLGDTIEHWYLDPDKLPSFEEEFKLLSNLIGTNWYEVSWKMAVANAHPSSKPEEAVENVRNAFTEGKDKARGFWL